MTDRSEGIFKATVLFLYKSSLYAKRLHEAVASRSPASTHPPLSPGHTSSNKLYLVPFITWNECSYAWRPGWNPPGSTKLWSPFSDWLEHSQPSMHTPFLLQGIGHYPPHANGLTKGPTIKVLLCPARICTRQALTKNVLMGWREEMASLCSPLSSDDCLQSKEMEFPRGCFCW